MSKNVRARTSEAAGQAGPAWMSEQGRAKAVRSRFNAVRTRTLCKVSALATMIVAAGVAIAVGEGITNIETHAVHRAIEPAQDCSAKYAALLDLAELARRDGKSSEVVVRGLSDRGGAMSGCLRAAGNAGAR
ncbi:hypothetical protein R69927_04882 [Paraburkholderia domus]|uniref:Uncharacterized protein n=1 Tax=Paraburkholderia domus TaxID=2793075 RepID=A0A9N8N390_9BURK|nr:hypothetical protein [Paraburkholderia domus]CAE6716705.1 hypothetical protein R70006_01478 [Paraburkholderia domus]CAE6868170.1 hypothetical protein R70199_01387 [Paraburkholderia domus]CAE6892127.1 hypothetical protein R69927_04882 [Paraburkholderia domus]CAE6945116.1 hypothetical protein R70211_05920 [Paraburkholderia domus]